MKVPVNIKKSRYFRKNSGNEYESDFPPSVEIRPPLCWLVAPLDSCCFVEKVEVGDGVGPPWVHGNRSVFGV